jgi:hypothetical protein
MEGDAFARCGTLVGMTRWAALAGLAYVVLYVAAFTLGIEVGPSDREILEHYADSGARTKEVVAFFLIAGAALAFVVFALGLRSLIADGTLAALAWAGAIGYAILLLAGNAVSRTPAFASMDDEFVLDPNTRRMIEDAGFLLLASGAIAAMLLVAAVAIASLRFRAFPRWLGWTSVVVVPLLPLAVGFVGFLALFVWVLAASAALALGSRQPQS